MIYATIICKSFYRDGVNIKNLIQNKNLLKLKVLIKQTQDQQRSQQGQPLGGSGGCVAEVSLAETGKHLRQENYC